MAKTYYGYLCGMAYIDYDGTHETAEWVEPLASGLEPDKYRLNDSLGWYAWCEVEPEAGLIGPFDTEQEAIKTATDEDAFWAWSYSDVNLGDDPLGDHHGRNL